MSVEVEEREYQARASAAADEAERIVADLGRDADRQTLRGFLREAHFGPNPLYRQRGLGAFQQHCHLMALRWQTEDEKATDLAVMRDVLDEMERELVAQALI